VVALAGAAAPYDLIFTCPPYASLERYSDDERDISTLSYAEFVGAYREIMHAAASLLAEDRFVVVVVGEMRNYKGNYVGLVNDTTDIMREAGLHLYNDAILMTTAGTLPMRVSRSFPPGRKLGRTHQNVMVYVKGDGMRAARACALIGDDLVE
jgi:DNA modification methylase